MPSTNDPTVAVPGSGNRFISVLRDITGVVGQGIAATEPLWNRGANRQTTLSSGQSQNQPTYQGSTPTTGSVIQPTTNNNTTYIVIAAVALGVVLLLRK